MTRINSVVYILLLTLSSTLISFNSNAQVNEDQLGAWYMYFYDAKFGESQFGVKGDIQFRNWDLGGDLEQLFG